MHTLMARIGVVAVCFIYTVPTVKCRASFHLIRSESARKWENNRMCVDVCCC